MHLRSFTVLALLAAGSLAHAQDRPIGFQTPSKNIACQFYSDNGQGNLRCDIMNMESPPAPSRRLRARMGQRLRDERKGKQRAASAPAIPSWTHRWPCSPMAKCGKPAGFTCRSEQTGLTCFNAMQHGFSLARAEQKVF